jgi:hypothetical protein
MTAYRPTTTRHDAVVSVGVSLAALTTGTGLIALYLTVSPAAAMWGCVIVLAVIVLAVAITAMAHDSREWGTPDPDAWTRPLHKPTAAEQTLTTDLRQRRMLLRPRGISERHARALAAKVARRTRRLRGLAHMARGTRPAVAEPAPQTAPAQPLRAAGTGGWGRMATRLNAALDALGHPHRAPLDAPKRGRHSAAGMVPQTVTIPVLEDGYPGSEEFVHEDVTDTLPAQMPQAQDDPGPLFSDDTGWGEFLALGRA